MTGRTALPALPPGPCRVPNGEGASVQQFLAHGRSVAPKPSDFHFERVGDASGISIATKRSSAPFGSLGRQFMLI